MIHEMIPMSTPERSGLCFESKVRGAVTFLDELGFVPVEALPTLVRFQKDHIGVDAYHGRLSYEIDAGVSGFGTRYSMSEVIRVSDPKAAEAHRVASTTTSDGVAVGLAELSVVLKRYGTAAFRGEPEFFSRLARQRERWSENYALDVLADQLRPSADEAFRRGDCCTAADLSSRIRTRLSPAENKKLAIAQERSKR